MRTTFLLLSLLLCCQETVFSMEKYVAIELTPIISKKASSDSNEDSSADDTNAKSSETTTNDKIANIFAAINNLKKNNPVTVHAVAERLYVTEDIKKLNPKDVIGIIQVYDRSEQFTRQIFSYLRKENKDIARAFKHYEKIIHENIKNVTYATLDTVTDPTSSQQPSALKEELPQPLLKYLIKRALKHIDANYTMEFSHDFPVIKFAISEKNHLAATATENKRIHLWNLKTAQKVTTIQEVDNIMQLEFNPSGSNIAAALHRPNAPDYYINIRDSMGVLLYTIDIPNYIKEIHYAVPTPTTSCQGDTLAVITRWKKQHDIMELWTLKNKKAEYTSTVFMHNTNIFRDEHCGKKYTACNPDHQFFNKKTLTVTKMQCPIFHIIHDTIDKTEDLASLQKIENSHLFNNELTQHEQKNIRDTKNRKVKSIQDSPPYNFIFIQL